MQRIGSPPFLTKKGIEHVLTVNWINEAASCTSKCLFNMQQDLRGTRQNHTLHVHRASMFSMYVVNCTVSLRIEIMTNYTIYKEVLRKVILDFI